MPSVTPQWEGEPPDRALHRFTLSKPFPYDRLSEEKGTAAPTRAAKPRFLPRAPHPDVLAMHIVFQHLGFPDVLTLMGLPLDTPHDPCLDCDTSRALTKSFHRNRNRADEPGCSQVDGIYIRPTSRGAMHRP